MREEHNLTPSSPLTDQQFALARLAPQEVRHEFLLEQGRLAGKLAEYLLGSRETNSEVVKANIARIVPSEFQRVRDVGDTVARGMESLHREYETLRKDPGKTLGKYLGVEFDRPVKLQYSPLGVLCFLEPADYRKVSSTSWGLTLRRTSLPKDLQGRLLLVNLGTTSGNEHRPKHSIDRTVRHELLHSLSYHFIAPRDVPIFSKTVPRLGTDDALGPSVQSLGGRVRSALLFYFWTEAVAYFGSGDYRDVVSSQFLDRVPANLRYLNNALCSEDKAKSRDSKEVDLVFDSIYGIVRDSFEHALGYQHFANSALRHPGHRHIDKQTVLGLLLTTWPESVDDLAMTLGRDNNFVSRSNSRRGARYLETLRSTLRETLETPYREKKEWDTPAWRALRNDLPTREFFLSSLSMREWRLVLRHSEFIPLLHTALNAVMELAPLVDRTREYSVTTAAIDRMIERFPREHALREHALRAKKLLHEHDPGALERQRSDLRGAYTLLHAIDQERDKSAQKRLVTQLAEFLPARSVNFWMANTFPMRFVDMFDKKEDLDSLATILDRTSCCVTAAAAATKLREVLDANWKRVPHSKRAELLTTVERSLEYFREDDAAVTSPAFKNSCVGTLEQLRTRLRRDLKAGGV